MSACANRPLLSDHQHHANLKGPEPKLAANPHPQIRLAMAFKFSLGAAKAANAKAKAEEDAKEREEKLALEKVMADFEEEHSGSKGILGESERDHEAEEDVFVPTGSKRHFTGRQRSMKSGPGTLEPEPLDGFPRQGGPGRLPPQAPSRFGGGVPSRPSGLESARQVENVYTTLVAKASNLPPTIDSRRVEELFADFPSLKVTKVEKIPPQGPAIKGRPSATMKVVFDKDAVARDLDDAMMKLNDKKYLGRGYYLHLDRYLGGKAADTTQSKEAFGARWQAPELPKGYAPPPDLGGGNRDGPRQDRDQLIVTANLPPDMAMTRLIHQTIEGVIEGGIEFEAALMNDPQVQDEERFAWLYDQKHPLNRYYRWRLHQIVCDTSNSEIFENFGLWNGPTEPLADEFAGDLGAIDLVDNSSDSDEEEVKHQHKPLPIGDNYPGRVDNGYGILNPYSRAMLLWLLTTLPPGSLVIDDVAAISVFAVEHAAHGMDEVVDILLANVVEPFQLTDANSRKRAPETEGKDDIRRPDVRQVTLNALRIVHDVLFTTSKESGVAYRYRLAIGTQLMDRKIFEHLEQLPAALAMGRMTERSYRDEVNSILKVWEEESFFEKATLEHLEEVFNARERQKEQDENERKLAGRRKRKLAPKAVSARKAEAANANEGEDVDADADELQTPDPLVAEEAVDDAPRFTLTTAESSTADATSKSLETVEQPVARQAAAPEEIPGETAAARARRLRPKAEDMFASDEE
jgi:U2-associated protein SR140